LAVDDWVFYEVFGLFRLAGVAQQIYDRFHQARPAIGVDPHADGFGEAARGG
jgi:aminoglycoside phosphotransferase (APT) family kinase protein